MQSIYIANEYSWVFYCMRVSSDFTFSFPELFFLSHLFQFFFFILVLSFLRCLFNVISPFNCGEIISSTARLSSLEHILAELWNFRARSYGPVYQSSSPLKKTYLPLLPCLPSTKRCSLSCRKTVPKRPSTSTDKESW